MENVELPARKFKSIFRGAFSDPNYSFTRFSRFVLILYFNISGINSDHGEVKAIEQDKYELWVHAGI